MNDYKAFIDRLSAAHAQVEAGAFGVQEFNELADFVTEYTTDILAELNEAQTKLDHLTHEVHVYIDGKPHQDFLFDPVKKIFTVNNTHTPEEIEAGVKKQGVVMYPIDSDSVS